MNLSNREEPLSTSNHSRDSASLKYVYPVLSRRARGVSLGINLNPNNACNWACAYCQVDGLVRGAAPDLDLNLLESELQSFLENLADHLKKTAPEGNRTLKDLAFSGNGEPTTCTKFLQAVESVQEVLSRFDLLGKLPVRLITNGSLLHQSGNISALEKLSQHKGEVWFKIDSALSSEIEKISGVKRSPVEIQKSLKRSSEICPTWIQTCLVSWDGKAPTSDARNAYREFLESALSGGTRIHGIFLYSLAREARQANSHRAGKVSLEILEEWSEGLQSLGLDVQINV